jgi:hypothetical protein
LHFPDRRGSLSIGFDGAKVLVKCWVCSPGDRAGQLKFFTAFAQALGLRRHEFFEHPSSFRSPRRGRPAAIAIYEYTEHVAKLRNERKQFWWRTRDPNAPGGYRPGVPDGFEPPLFNIAAVKGIDEIFVVEGEKSVRILADADVVAVCGPFGAGKWETRHTAAIVAAGVRRVVILPDNDRAGRESQRELLAVVTKPDSSPPFWRSMVFMGVKTSWTGSIASLRLGDCASLPHRPRSGVQPHRRMSACAERKKRTLSANEGFGPRIAQPYPSSNGRSASGSPVGLGYLPSFAK